MRRTAGRAQAEETALFQHTSESHAGTTLVRGEDRQNAYRNTRVVVISLRPERFAGGAPTVAESDSRMPVVPGMLVNMLSQFACS